MQTYSLLQLSLDQRIERRELEDASLALTSLKRPDCAMLHRQLFGVVVSNLAEDEALAFQAELLKRDYPTRLVPDGGLPLLPESFQVQGIGTREGTLVFTDSLGHLRIRPVCDLEFMAAGVVSRLHFKSVWNQHLDYGIESTGAPRLVTEHELYEESEMEFRIDFFFRSLPARQHASACAESMIHHHGTPLRLQDSGGLQALAMEMAALLPEERLGSYFRNPGGHPPYRTLRNYQNEIRWHLHGLRTREGSTAGAPGCGAAAMEKSA